MRAYCVCECFGAPENSEGHSTCLQAQYLRVLGCPRGRRGACTLILRRCKVLRVHILLLRTAPPSAAAGVLRRTIPDTAATSAAALAVATAPATELLLHLLLLLLLNAGAAAG
eukprot:1137439-Pelagomonas_calceolata.AAC.3